MSASPFLEKLEITVDKNEQKTFVVPFNPESYSLQYNNEYSKPQGINTTGKKSKYIKTPPKKLALTLIFDGRDFNNGSKSNTNRKILGAINPIFSAPENIALGVGDVYKQVQKFLKLAYEMDGKKHEPNSLKIVWGDLSFKGYLETVDVKYTLFTRSGNPLRANLDVVFIGELEESKRVKEENKSSPDLTHVREVKNSDTLPLMAQEIYEDSAYYIQLARANNLNNFRQLKPGTTINLPPIKK
ncbi:MAG: hypothetical protein F6J86_19975 [Symploca sp. SIO1B1]|nr:hypothetical protein [Symploca sp. SIO1B1]